MLINIKIWRLDSINIVFLNRIVQTFLFQMQSVTISSLCQLFLKAVKKIKVTDIRNISLLFKGLPGLQDSFLLIDKPVVLKCSTHSRINFLSGTALFRPCMKWGRTCRNYRFISHKEKFQQQTNGQAIILTDIKMVRHYLHGATITTCLTSQMSI